MDTIWKSELLLGRCQYGGEPEWYYATETETKTDVPPYIKKWNCYLPVYPLELQIGQKSLGTVPSGSKG